MLGKHRTLLINNIHWYSDFPDNDSRGGEFRGSSGLKNSTVRGRQVCCSAVCSVTSRDIARDVTYRLEVLVIDSKVSL